MPRAHLAKVRKICLSLPEAKEVEAWGAPTFRIGKIFAMYAQPDNHHGDGREGIWVKSDHFTQDLLCRGQPTRYFKPPYVGPQGWTGVYLDPDTDWIALTILLRDAYRVTAPKKLAALVPDDDGDTEPVKVAAKKEVSKKVSNEASGKKENGRETQMKIREATVADGAAIRAIVKETLAEFGFPVESSGIDADLSDVPQSYQSRGGAFRVIEDENGTIVGCGGLYPVDDKSVELRKMYFRPEIRGRGLGRRLLDDLVTEARRRDYERIELETASNLEAAIALYQRAGFVETEGPKHSDRCDRTFALDLR